VNKSGWSWWKLGALWLLNLKGRTPDSKRALVGHSVKIAWIGLAFGLAALSLTLAIVSGFEHQLARVVAETGGHVLHQNTWLKLEDLQRRAALAPEGPVRELEIFWNTNALVVGPKGGKGVNLEAFRRFDDAGDFVAQKYNKDGLSEDDIKIFDEFSSSKIPVELGSALSDYIGAEVGTSIRVLIPGVTRSSLDLEVIGIRKLGMYELDSRWMRAPEQALRMALLAKDRAEFEARAGDAHGIRYFFKDEWSGPERKTELALWSNRYAAQLNSSEIEEMHNPFLRTWFEQKQNLFGSIGMDKQVLSLVLALLCLVSALNVAAALVILFLERDKEVALLRAIGMTRRRLLLWIVSQGFLLGVGSVIAAAILSRVLAWGLLKLPIAQIPQEIYNLSELPVEFVMSEQLWVALFGIMASCMLSFVVGLGLVTSPFLETLSHRD